MEVGSLALPVEDPSRIGEARREAAALARRVGFSEQDESRVSIVATELATNLHRHATRDRWFLARALQAPDGAEVELIALDGGPGIGSLTVAERDGFSTAGGRGEGFSAMRRLADALDVHTSARGTALLARLRRERAGTTAAASLGSIRVAKHGEERCGDAWTAELRPERTTILVADGLGHGYDAAEAALLAVESFHGAAGLPLRDRISHVHRALAVTRGAAIAIAEIDAAAGRVSYAGLGNISGVIVTRGATRSMVSLHGTAGKTAPRITEFAYEWSADSVLVMHTDGIATRWDLASYPDIWNRHPSLIAAVLFRDHARGRDDACAVVYRMPSDGRS